MGAALKLVWNIDLTFLMKHTVEIETKEGLILSGKLTGVEFQDLRIGTDTVQLPIAIELDNSHHERVPMTQLVRLVRKE